MNTTNGIPKNKGLARSERRLNVLKTQLVLLPVSMVATRLAVSAATVRADIKWLATNGFIKKHRDGYVVGVTSAGQRAIDTQQLPAVEK